MITTEKLDPKYGYDIYKVRSRRRELARESQVCVNFATSFLQD